MNIPSQLDQNQDIIKRLVAEQLKKNALNYNIDEHLDWGDNVPNYTYTATGLDGFIDRDLTKKERAHRSEAFERIRNIYYTEGGNPLSFMDGETQRIGAWFVELTGHLGLDILDVETQGMFATLKKAFETLDIIDILDVGEQ